MSRVVVVTGASGGIGRATVAEFARRGDRIALIARGQTGLDAAAAECQELGAATLTVPLDVSDASAVAAAVERIETELGPIDVWVNVAFTSVFSRFDDITPEEYRRATEVSYLGYVYATMAVLPRMKARNRGTIVHVGSAGLSRHSPADCLLRCQARHPGIPRGAALRVAARAQRRARDDGADAGREHPAVLVGALPLAKTPPACAADLPARGRRPRRPVCR